MYGDDPELAYAIKMSMMEQAKAVLQVPETPPDDADPDSVCTLQLRLPNGKTTQRRFFKTDTVKVRMHMFSCIGCAGLR